MSGIQFSVGIQHLQ